MTSILLDEHPTLLAHAIPGLALSPGAALRPGLLTRSLLEAVVALHRVFEPERQLLLAARQTRQAAYDAGEIPSFLPPSAASDPSWQVAPIPKDLSCRRVEITGPVNSAKMVIQMLMPNGEGDRADCAMLDFEDSMKPTWANVTAGFENVLAAVQGTLAYDDPESGRHYALDRDQMAKLMVRVRGLHLNEGNVTIDGTPVCAGLFDLVVVALLTAKYQVELGETPTFYVPKIEDRAEAVWWNRLFERIENLLDLPTSTLRATFLIETLPAAFQMEEILYELRDHIVALNVGRWDKIFSDIKVLHNHPDRVLADRGTLTMDKPWMRNYALRLVRICHLHGAYALGGMAAFTPGRDAETRTRQRQRVIADKQREFAWGHDGCWVSHPFFIGPAMESFTVPHQRGVIPHDIYHYPDLMPRGEGPRTLAGLRQNVQVGIAYLQGWEQGLGCISWNNLMEDLATLEISRVSVWQWLRHQVLLQEGMRVTPELVTELFEEELAKILEDKNPDETPAWIHAAESAKTLFLQTNFRAFLSFGSDPEWA